MFVKLEPVAEAPLADDSAATAANGRDPRLGTLAGNYRLVERLGAGGMGSIYRAEHKDLSGAVVAVKLLDRGGASTPGAGRRFLREAQAMFEIVGRNRHIPRVLDYGQTAEGENYMVMEYLRGHDLAQVLKREGPMPWPRAAALVLQLCDALAAAHARGILHRDIKPSNCFLVEEDGAELVKLIDFGVAKDLRVVEDQTSEGMVVGTPAFLAPELLIDGARPSSASDVYSLGATLYRLLTNKPHVTGQNWEDIAYRLQFVPLLPPSTHVGPRLSPAVDELVLRALHRDPEKRYASALELADAIRRCLPRSSPDSAWDGRQPVTGWSGARVFRSAAGRRALAFGTAPLLAVGILAFTDAPRPRATDPAPESNAPRPPDVVAEARVARRSAATAPMTQTTTTATMSRAAPAAAAMGDRLEQLENAVQALSRRVGDEKSPAGDVTAALLQRTPGHTKRSASPRERVITRELTAVRDAVGVCFARHADNLTAELPVRVQVSSAGEAIRITLPNDSRPGLIRCVTEAIRARRYATGAAPTTVRHVFKFRDP
ncbi:serine/threonine-protein kinase [Nannocystis punicea]|uniref:Serine/threonine-protein kinase n=1 Tax=Nannocystis punicea TaxID=2995304 RepID=A0ABY7H602_9BACT|nr:serine/threonine-protein kinase [Nannocystis poenicansa]WAS94520.1 serine/threonine-protein kinase [Nannocystis poenicansa]